MVTRELKVHTKVLHIRTTNRPHTLYPFSHLIDERALRFLHFILWYQILVSSRHNFMFEHLQSMFVRYILTKYKFATKKVPFACMMRHLISDRKLFFHSRVQTVSNTIRSVWHEKMQILTTKVYRDGAIVTNWVTIF